MLGDAAVRFSHAIARAPAASATRGLRAVDTGAPDLARLAEDHAAYVAALRAAGVAVTVLPPLEAFPDSLFVEDAALCLPQGAILMRPGAPSRLGEAAEIAPALSTHYADLAQISGAASFIEGGDILVTGREVLVGRSARTNAAGVGELRGILDGWRLPLREVETPAGVLHFKTDCALLDPETILATDRLAASGCFEGYRVLPTASGEEAGANAIRVNGVVLMAEGFPRTQDRLETAGFTTVALRNVECARLDGGMSCLSLRFTPPKAP
jgi:dimethylargininase